jgi:outer membrane immunogenic protein
MFRVLDMTRSRFAVVIAALSCAGYVRAADMAVMAPPPVVTAHNWAGLYIGGLAGYNWSQGDVAPGATAVLQSHIPVASPFAAAQLAGIPAALSTPAAGFTGGGELGYNYQWDRYVLGVEADVSVLAGSGSNSFNTAVQVSGQVPGTDVLSATSVDRKVVSLGTVRGRVGFTPLNRLLIFATGGLAIGKAQSSTTIMQLCCAVHFGAPASGSASKTLTGWVLGGGLEYALTASWSVKAEYLHYDLGSMSYATTPLVSTRLVPPLPFTSINAAPTAYFKGDFVRGGINYKFDP